MSSSGGRGAGLGLKLLLGAGALAYGVKEATYTGKHTRYLDLSMRQMQAGCSWLQTNPTELPGEQYDQKTLSVPAIRPCHRVGREG